MLSNKRKNIGGGVTVPLVVKISFCILIILSLFFIQIASADVWSTPKIVNESGSQPALAVGKNNTLHFVWIENSKKLMYKRILNNGTTEIDSISVANYDNTRVTLTSPDIVVDSKNNAHIVVQYTQVTDQITYHWALYANVTSIGTRSELKILFEKQAISGGWTYDGLNPRIALDPIDDKPAIVMKVKESQTYFSWLSGSDETDFWDGIKVAKKKDAGVFDWKSVMRTKESSPTDLYDFPELAIDSAERYHIVWINKTDNKIWYKSFSNMGTSYPIIIANEMAKPWWPSIDIGSYDPTVHIAWEGEDGNIYYKKERFPDFPFGGNAEQITNNSESEKPKIVVDNNGTVHFVYKTKRDSGSLELYHYKIDKGSENGIGKFITNHTNTTEVPFSPDIGTDGLKIYVSWQSKGDSTSKINFSRTLAYPIIIVPGTGGTELYNNGERVWPLPEGWYIILQPFFEFISNKPLWLKILLFLQELDSSVKDINIKFDVLQLDSTGNSGYGITTGDILRDPRFFGILDFYSKLLEELKNEGYEENQNLWVFPYDWRLDIRENAEKLGEKIDQILDQTGEERITIIAHSQGGLVSKQFMNVTGSKKVDKFIVIGTPHLGLVKTFKALRYGYNFDHPLLLDSEAKKIVQNLPAVYQMLPSKKYFDVYNGFDIFSNEVYPYYFVSNLDINNVGIKKLNYDQSIEMLRMNYNKQLINDSIFFHENLDEWSGKSEGVESYVIVGSGLPTLAVLGERKIWWRLQWQLAPSEITLYTHDYGLINGDKTVPLRSATYVPDVLELPYYNNTQGYSKRIYYVNKINHGNLPNNPAVINLIKNILKSGEGSEVDGIISYYPYPFAGTLHSIHSPVDIHFYNSEGNHTGPLANGTIEEGIPDSQYDTINTSKFGFIPKGEKYNVLLNSTGTGYFDYQIQIYDNDSIKKTILYRNIQIIPETHANLYYNEGSDNFTLDVDYDGDGIFESLIEPNVIYEGGGANKTAISIAGKLGINEWYVSDVNITLIPAFNPYDARVEFSIDNGIIWQNYLLPITLASDGVYNLMAKSRLENMIESPPVDKLIKVDRTPPRTSINLNGTQVNDSIFNSNVTVTLIASDGINGSGINEIIYSRDDGSNWIQYNESFVISSIGKTKILYKSKDKAGNIEHNKTAIVDLVNLAPVIEILPDITVNETSFIHLTPSASDPELDPLTFTFSPPLNSSGMWQTTYEDAGEYTARVTVSDGFSNVSQDVKITVLNVNRPPILAPIGTLGAMEGSYFSYSVSASDPDKDQLTYSDDSPMFEINPFTGEIGFVPQDAGNYSFNITVSDGASAVSANVSLEVRNTNNPPEMEFIFPATAAVGRNFTLQVNASDPDGDKLLFSDDADLFDINATSGVIEFTPGSEQIGTYFINITVSDGVERDYEVLNLVVRPETPLRLDPIQDIVAYVGDLVKIVANATYR